MGIFGFFFQFLGVITFIVILCIVLAITVYGESFMKIQWPKPKNTGSDETGTDEQTNTAEDGEGDGDALLQFMNHLKKNVYLTEN